MTTVLAEAPVRAEEIERRGFYRRTLERLLAERVLDPAMSVLVVAGGRIDQQVFQELGFDSVTISNIDDSLTSEAFRPYEWSFQDAENLTYPDESFDFAVVSAALHHCHSPHRAVLEMYRVARRGLLALESRDSLLMRAAIAAGVVDEYEVTAVLANGFRSGGVRNSSIPNFVYRWTEREVTKMIASHAPFARHRVIFYREFQLPFSVLDLRTNRRRAALVRLLQPLVTGVTRMFPRQGNLFAFAVLKPELPRDLFPWLKVADGGLAPDEDWIRSRWSVPCAGEAGDGAGDAAGG